MRLLILSDLHLESGGPYTVPAELQYDVVVLAGDIRSPGVLGVEWATKTFESKPVVLVAGNHEFYGELLPRQLDAMRQTAQGTNVHVLSSNAVTIHGVRFLGATLWTDFKLAIASKNAGALEHMARAMSAARLEMLDYSLIRFQEPSGLRRNLAPADTLALHQAERAWLLSKLREPFDGTTVVVTHHGPSAGSVAPKYADDWCTPAFVSDLPEEFFETPDLWVHGHTHTSFDYKVAGCRVVSNPRGYRLQDGSWENPQFNPSLVVDVEV